MLRTPRYVDVLVVKGCMWVKFSWMTAYDANVVCADIDTRNCYRHDGVCYIGTYKSLLAGVASGVGAVSIIDPAVVYSFSNMKVEM